MFEKAVDLLFAAFVPLRFRQPAPKIVGKVNLALTGHDPVWKEGKPAFDEAFDHLCHRAAGVDPPDDVLFLAQLADQIEKPARDRCGV